MRLKKKLLFAAVAAALVCAVFAVGASAYAFSDVTQYKDAVGILSDEGIIRGYDSKTFGPEDDVTRWQMALMLTKLVTGDTDSATWYEASSSVQFTDIKGFHYMGSIAYAHQNGIIVGRNSQTFDPDSNITLQEGATMAIRALGYPRSEYDAGWPDSYLSLAGSLNLLEGIESVKPTDTLTRGQAAQLLYNMFYTLRYGDNMPYAEASFGLAGTYVLTATPSLRITSNVSYPSSGEAVLSELDPTGALGTSVKYKFAALGLTSQTAGQSVGASFSVLKKYGSDEDVYISMNAATAYTNGLSADVNLGTVTLGGAAYKVVSGPYSYRLEKSVAPDEREIIIYGVNYLFSDSKSSRYSRTGVLSAGNIAGTTGVYRLTAFDDNGDGWADRALYTPFLFGRYTVDENGRLSIAGGAKLTEISVVNQTGTAAGDGDYVIYSYNQQNKTLEIAAVFGGMSQGVLTAVSTAGKTATINAVSYTVGNENLPGASFGEAVDALDGDYINISVKYIVYKGTIIYMEEDADAAGLAANVYSLNLAVVVDTDTDDLLGTECLTLRVITATSDDTEIYASHIDGKNARLSLTTLKAGDIVSYVKDDGNYNGYDTYSVREITASPSVEQLSAPYKLAFSPADYTLTFSPSSGGGALLSLKASPFAKYIIYDPTSGTKFKSGLLTSLASSLLSGSLTMPTGYTAYLSYGSGSVGLGTKYVELVCLRPDVNDEDDYVYNFTSIVYLDIADVSQGGWDAATNSQGKYRVNFAGAFNMFTGTNMVVNTVVDTITGLTGYILEPGYYRVSGSGELVSNTPLGSSTQGTLITLYKNVSVKSVTQATTGKYTIKLADNTTLTVPAVDFYYMLSGSLITSPTANSAGFNTFLTDVTAGELSFTVDIMLKLSSVSSSEPTVAVIVRELIP